MGAGKSAGKTRLSVRHNDDRSAKRHKPALAAPAQRGIRQFLQPLPRAPQHRAANGSRDSSTEPEDNAGQLPGQTPAVPLLAAAAAPPTGAPTGAGAMLQTALLRSLQHRFATQQALDTPAGWAAGEAQQEQQGAALPQQAQHDFAPSPPDDDDDGFQIFSQLAYEPTFLSQRPPEVEAEPGGATSQLPTQTQADLPGCSQRNNGAAGPPAAAGSIGIAAGSGAAAGCQHSDDGEGDDLDWPPASQQCTQPQVQQAQQEEAARRASGVTLKTTPALQSVERVQVDAGGASGQKMFPLFQRRDSCKKLYIVRHGESTCNAAMAARGSGWADPQIFDAQLTDKGKQQARALRHELAKLNLPPDTLWITSPLQRAMQTLLLACPHPHLLGSAGGCTGSGSAENSSALPNGGGGAAPRVAVLHTITEKIITCGDIGHPASQLRKLYPQLEGQLAALPELWWHCPPGKPNCALQKLFGSGESRDLLLSRIGAFRRWLQEQPEKVIVAVGHSSYWRQFEEVCRGTKPTHMKNCEVRMIHF
ncbi:hypothetical protein ABPG77_003214 [Micractinium sp. CCAP 211/92]